MSDMALSIVAARGAQTLHTAQILVAKKQHEMEMSLVSMLAEAVERAPDPKPAGMGAAVDKRA